MLGWTVAAASAIAALFHLYAAGISPFTALIQRPVHLALMATLGFLGVGVQRKIQREKSDRGTEASAPHSEEAEQEQAADGSEMFEEPRVNWLNWMFVSLMVAVCL